MIKLRMCPRCKSTDVSANLSSQAIFNNSYICNKCGFESMFFPEIETKKTKKK